jgi:salicylate hydroxylase
VTARLWMGPGRHFIHYFVRDRRLLCFVAIVEQDTWTRESWIDRGHLADAQAAFAGWHPQVRAILAAADDSFLGHIVAPVVPGQPASPTAPLSLAVSHHSK